MSVIRTFVQGDTSIRDLPWLPIIAALSLCLWLAYSATLHIHEIKAANTQDVQGYQSPRWTNSKLLEYLRSVSVDSKIFTNNAAIEYIHIDNPDRYRNYRRTYIQSDLRQYLYRSAANGDYVVWFYDWPRLEYNHIFLRALPELRVMADLSDGIVFEVDRSYMDVPVSMPDSISQYQQFTEPSGEPAIRAFFDLYLVDDTLIYIRDQCRAEDTKARFFLHIIPTRQTDLPEHRQQYGFKNLDFSVTGHDWNFVGRCVATRDLPEYGISSIRTGQFVSGSGQLWHVELPVNE